jgi:hypothetical protein
MESNIDQQILLGFSLVKSSFNLNDRRKNIFGSYQDPVLNLSDSNDRAGVESLDSFRLYAIENGDVVGAAQKNPNYIKDNLLPAVSRVLWAKTFSDKIKERIKSGVFDQDQAVKNQVTAITIYLDYSCQKVGKLLHAGLGMIWAQKEEELSTVFDEVSGSFNAIPELQEQLVALIDGTSSYECVSASDLLGLIKIGPLGYQGISEANLMKLQKTIENPVQPVESPTSDAPETQQTGWRLQGFLSNFLNQGGNTP